MPTPALARALPAQAEATHARLVKDPALFQAAIAPVLPQAYRLCMTLCRNKAEADDLLQDSLVRAFLHCESFEGRGELGAWLSRIVRHQFIETRRLASRRRGLLDQVVEGCASVLGSIFGGEAPPDPEQLAGQSEEAAELMAAMRALPETFREVVLLCDLEGLGYPEVAETLGLPVGTVKSRHSRGRARLLEALSSLRARRAPESPDAVRPPDAPSSRPAQKGERRRE